jgi:hypothetical protein
MEKGGEPRGGWEVLGEGCREWGGVDAQRRRQCARRTRYGFAREDPGSALGPPFGLDEVALAESSSRRYAGQAIMQLHSVPICSRPASLDKSGGGGMR